MENQDQSVPNLGLKCPLCIVPNINIGPSALKQHMELFHQVNPSGIPFYHLNHSIQETANRALLIEKNARDEAIQTISNELYNVKIENSNYSTQLKNIQSEVKFKNEEILKSQIKIQQMEQHIEELEKKNVKLELKMKNIESLDRLQENIAQQNSIVIDLTQENKRLQKEKEKANQNVENLQDELKNSETKIKPQDLDFFKQQIIHLQNENSQLKTEKLKLKISKSMKFIGGSNNSRRNSETNCREEVIDLRMKLQQAQEIIESLNKEKETFQEQFRELNEKCGQISSKLALQYTKCETLEIQMKKLMEILNIPNENRIFMNLINEVEYLKCAYISEKERADNLAINS